ncbi:MAG: hypothetical protein A2138_07745 [Deltaproteobacteria bacterium RBG_16_71_12]|nr:MAG: hypothetical protein A2138_07745 [Deltaproteobacteria bacterium RBG_16_71_12]
MQTNGGHGAFSTMYDANDNDTGCRECHATTPIDSRIRDFTVSHNAVSGLAGGFGTTHYQPEHCKVCHTAWQAEPKEWAIDYAGPTCTADCHGVNPPHGAGCLPGSQTDC